MSRRRRQTQDGSRVILPITPMLDMSFQLLFFFIFNFNPADLEGAVEMALPVGPPGMDRPDRPAEPRVPASLTVCVRAAVDGHVSAITVRDLAGKDQPVEGIAGLKKALTAARGKLEDREALRLQGDGGLGVRHLVEVMDACRASGFTKITFVTPAE